MSFHYCAQIWGWLLFCIALYFLYFLTEPPKGLSQSTSIRDALTPNQTQCSFCTLHSFLQQWWEFIVCKHDRWNYAVCSVKNKLEVDNNSKDVERNQPTSVISNMPPWRNASRVHSLLPFSPINSCLLSTQAVQTHICSQCSAAVSCCSQHWNYWLRVGWNVTLQHRQGHPWPKAIYWKLKMHSVGKKGSWQTREESRNSGWCKEVAVSLPFSQSFKLFQKKSTGRTRYENPERSSKGHEGHSSAGSQIVSRCHASWHFPDDSLLSSRYSLADTTMNLSVFYLTACLPPLSPVYMNNKLFHVPKLDLSGLVFFKALCLVKIFPTNLTKASGDYTALLP